MNLAIFLLQYNQTAEALWHFEYALRIRPDYALAHLNYGLLLRNIGREPEASEQLRIAAAASDNSVRTAALQALSEMK